MKSKLGEISYKQRLIALDLIPLCYEKFTFPVITSQLHGSEAEGPKRMPIRVSFGPSATGLLDGKVLFQATEWQYSPQLQQLRYLYRKWSHTT